MNDLKGRREKQMKHNILNKTIIALSICILLSLGIGYGNTLADDYFVDATLGTDDSTHGSSPDDGAWKTITYALSQVTGSESNPATINIAAGTYNPTLGEVFPLNMEDYVSLQGEGYETTIIDADDTARVIQSYSVNNYYVDRITVQGGDMSSAGCGIYCYYSSPTITNCKFYRNNWAGVGGGMACEHSSPILENCIFDGNGASGSGGGIFNIDDSSPIIENCIFSGNQDFGDGGGIFNGNNSSPKIRNCIFLGNMVDGNGAGIANSNSSPTIENCIFIGNLAGTYYYNEGGGGISNTNSSSIIINCTFSANRSGYAACGGGIYNINSSPTITNCILWGNIAPSDKEIYNDETSNPIITYSDIDQDMYDGSNGNIRLDPLFVAGNDLHLKSESPCIDAGTSENAPPNDIDGESRPWGSGIDMGADEYIPMCQGNFDYDKDVDGSDASTFKKHFGRSTLKNPCQPDGPAPVEKTGQTVPQVDYDDGYYQRGVDVPLPKPRFSDNGDGTVTDNLTGLIWLRNANCFGGRTWNNALSDCNGLSTGFCGLTDGSSAGEWRLPNYKELFSLVDAENYNPALPSGHPFINVQSNYYWSSTTIANDTDSAWFVHMHNGHVLDYNKTGYYYVWPVRGGH